MTLQMLVVIGLFANVIFVLSKIIERVSEGIHTRAYILRQYKEQKRIDEINHRKDWIIAGYYPNKKA